jgi:hypothetical protein
MDTAQAAAAQILHEEPIMITIDAQEIGVCWKNKLTPTAFNQFLLENFKAAGAPVEGVINLKLARGKVCKMKSHPRGPGFFGYLWLSDEAWSMVDTYGRETGLTAHASGMEN